MAKWRSMDGKFDLQVKTATRHSSGGAARQAPWFVVARSALPLGTGNIGIGNISTLATFFSCPLGSWRYARSGQDSSRRRDAAATSYSLLRGLG